MRALAVLLLAALPLAAPPAEAQPRPPRPPGSAARSIGLGEAIAVARARFRGEVIAAEIAPGRPHERTAAVYAIRLLTPGGALLRVRVDAADGRFLEAEGRGLAEARRRSGGPVEDGAP